MGKLKDWFQNRKAQRELNKQEPLEKLDTISNNNATGETPDGDTWTPEGGFDLETGKDIHGNVAPWLQEGNTENLDNVVNEQNNPEAAVEKAIAPNPIDTMRDVTRQFRSDIYKNGTGKFSSIMNQLTEQQLKMAKDTYLNHSNVESASNNGSDEYTAARTGKDEAMKFIQGLEQGNNMLNGQIDQQAILGGNLSNANDPANEYILNAITSGNCVGGVVENGEKTFTSVDPNTGEDIVVTENELSDMQNSTIPKANQTANDLLLGINNLMENMGPDGVVDENKLKSLIHTALNVPSDASDTDPGRIIDQKRSLMKDSLAGQPSMEEWLTSKQGLGMLAEFYPGARDIDVNDIKDRVNDQLENGDSTLFDELTEPYIKNTFGKGLYNVPGVGEVPIEDVSSHGTLTWEAGYERWKAEGNEGTIEDFKKEANDWWDSPAGQKYAKENGFTHRIKAEGGETTEVVETDDDADIIAMTGADPIGTIESRKAEVTKTKAELNESAPRSQYGRTYGIGSIMGPK